MEKFGVIKDGITPDLSSTQKTAKAEDCVKLPIVDNNTDDIAGLDSDFRKKAASAAAGKLNH
jgi:hypothetical protein